MPIINEIVVIFALSIGVLLICHKLRLPTVVGYLVTGVLCGPHGLKLVGAVHDVENLATIGVILLLFTVGMEFSVKNIIKYKYYFFCGGVLQVCTTIICCIAMSTYGLGTPLAQACFLGFLICLSSTAIVIRALEDKNENESPHGRLILGILIFQDVIAVPMMLLIPLLAGVGEEVNLDYIYNFVKGVALLLFMAIIAFKGVPKLLYYVTRTKNRELFLLSVLTICFAVAWATSSIGLSLSLGAFLAGLVVSESEYSDEAVGNVLPFQSIFTSFFFVSMGMLLDIHFVIEQPFLIISIAAVIVLLKSFLAGGTAFLLGMPMRSAILVGIALGQVGEFSFVLAQTGMNHGMASDYQYQLFLAVSLLTMAVTPSLMSFAYPLANTMAKLPLPQKIKAGLKYSSEELFNAPKKNHMIIVGFGMRGKHLAKAAKDAKLDYLILEMNSETVKNEKAHGEPIHYGDPSHPSVLAHAGVKTANSLIIVINDAVATMRIITAARTLNPSVYIIVRSRYFREAQRLFQIGANDVIPDEFGSSIEIFTRVLYQYNVSEEKIHQCIKEVRMEGYKTLKWQNRIHPETLSMPIDSNETRIENTMIFGGSALIGKTVAESQLRHPYGLTILLIKRKNETITSIQADTALQEGDTLVVIGSLQNLTKAKSLFLPQTPADKLSLGTKNLPLRH